jgi:hypothetical protein
MNSEGNEISKFKLNTMMIRKINEMKEDMYKLNKIKENTKKQLNVFKENTNKQLDELKEDTINT